MKTIINVGNLTIIESLEHFLEGNPAIAFRVLGEKSDRYQFVEKILVKFRYITCWKSDKGIITRKSPGILANNSHDSLVNTKNRIRKMEALSYSRIFMSVHGKRHSFISQNR